MRLSSPSLWLIFPAMYSTWFVQVKRACQSTPERKIHSSRSPCCLRRVMHDRHLKRLANRWCRWQITGDPRYFPEEPCGWLATHPTTHSLSMCAVSCQWCKSETTEVSSHINQSLTAAVTGSHSPHCRSPWLNKKKNGPTYLTLFHVQ